MMPKNKKVKGNQQTLIPLNSVVIIQVVTVLIPERCESAKVNEAFQTLLKSFIRWKLSDKTIENGQRFVIMIFGIEEMFEVVEIKLPERQSLEVKEEETETEHPKENCIVSQQTKINLVRKKEIIES